jgi:RNA polymerase sigma factor (sigma-70 family)
VNWRETDSELVTAFLLGERAGFEALVDRHRPRLRALAFALLGDREDPEDVVQEALLRAYLGLASLREPARFRSWVSAIVVNVARMRLRRPRRESASLEDLAGTGASLSWAEGPAPEEAVELEELARVVREALEALPRPQREVVVLHYVDGLSCREIAARLGESAGTVRVRLHRARARLRKLLPGLAPSMRKESSMIEVRIEDVYVRVLAEHSKAEEPEPEARERRADLRIAVLRELSGKRRLPIWIGRAEGDSLAMGLRGEPLPRPLTPDLMVRLIGAAGARIERVVVSRLEEKTFYALIALRVGDEVEEVDARPSDAFNLALRADAPIFVDDEVMRQSSAIAEDVPTLLDRDAEEIYGTEGAPAGEWKPVELVTWQPPGK